MKKYIYTGGSLKSQSSLLIAVVILGIVISFIIFNLFVETGTKERALRSIFLNEISKYLDFSKGFLRTSFIYSSHLASSRVAHFGGLGTSIKPVEPRTWICNGPTPQEPEEIKFWLNDETLRILNNYTKILNLQKELVLINASSFSCVNYEAENSKIFNGYYDEGFFNISGEGCKVNVSSIKTPDFVSSLANLKVLLPQDRIFYLYRNFYDWANEEGEALVSRICGCIELICDCAGNGDCEQCNPLQECIHSNFALSKEILQSKFDEYVECWYTIQCCKFESQSCPLDKDARCLLWDTRKCEGCYIPPSQSSCKVSFSTLEEATVKTTLKFLTQEECEEKKCEYWQENRETMYGIFECTDKKYYLSLKDGTGPLTFRVSVWISLRKPLSCYKQEKCQLSNQDCVCPIPGACEPCK